MLALAGQSSLHGYNACLVYWAKGALRRNCRQRNCGTSFSPERDFLFSRKSRVRFWCLVFWHLWIGRARRGLVYFCALDIEEVFIGATDSDVHLFAADVIKSFDTVDREILDGVLSSLGLLGSSIFFRISCSCQVTV